MADSMVRCFATGCSGLGLRCCARRNRMVRCMAIRCSVLAGPAVPDEIAWYVALLQAEMGCACAAAPDGIAW